MLASKLGSELLQYIAANGQQPGDRLPPLAELSTLLGLSVSKLREQLEVVRVLGLVEVKPRAGIRRTEYRFLPAVKYSLLCALALDRGLFTAYSELRSAVEVAFFHEAVARLTEEDKANLRALVGVAQTKLRGTPIQIPHAEHRQLHLGIFERLDNPFVLGVLAAYWEAYEAVELNLYADYQYLQEVWEYHSRIVEFIIAGDADRARAALIEHFGLLRYRPGSERERSKSDQ